MSYMPSRNVVFPELVVPSMVRVRSGVVMPSLLVSWLMLDSEGLDVPQEPVQPLGWRDEDEEVLVRAFGIAAELDGQGTRVWRSPPPGHEPAGQRVPACGRLRRRAEAPGCRRQPLPHAKQAASQREQHGLGHVQR